MHLLDEQTDEYNRPFVKPGDGLALVRGYVRRQGLIYRPGMTGRNRRRSNVSSAWPRQGEARPDQPQSRLGHAYPLRHGSAVVRPVTVDVLR